MSEWSDQWNAMPIKYRKIGSMIETQMRINQLHKEKDRLEKRYRQSVREVNDHIGNLKRSLKEAKDE